jgi:hypothetical protein
MTRDEGESSVEKEEGEKSEGKVNLSRFVLARCGSILLL